MAQERLISELYKTIEKQNQIIEQFKELLFSERSGSLNSRLSLPPSQDEDFYASLDEVIAESPLEFKTLAEAFRQNLRSVLLTARLPIWLQTVLIRNFRLIYLAGAEAGKAGHLDLKVNNLILENFLEDAHQKVREEAKNLNDSTLLIDQILRVYDFRRFISNENFSQPLDEILYQGVVLIWGSLEALNKKLRGIANKNPSKKGEVKEKLEEILNSSNVQLLKKRRDLIVHQRGVVDQRYIEETGDNLASGSKLLVNLSTLDQHLFIARDSGIAFLKETKKILCS
jgi:hypothetical protein